MKKTIVIAAVMALFVGGCSEKCAQKCAQNVVSEPLQIGNTTVEKAMWEAKCVLSKMNFRIDKFDVENGYLRTRALPACQLFAGCGENSVNAGAFNKAEAGIHSITRTVEMEFCQVGNSVSVETIACTKRLSMTEKEISSISETAKIFSKSSKSEQRLLLDTKDSELDWVNLGRDGMLECKINSLLECNM